MHNALLKNTIYLKSCATLQTYKPTLPNYQDRISRVWHKSLMLLKSPGQKSLLSSSLLLPQISPKFKTNLIFNYLVCFLKIY